MRSTKVNGELLQEILESNNIPSFLQKEEYFEKREIKLMLTLISLINNHHSGYSACKRYAFTDMVILPKTNFQKSDLKTEPHLFTMP